MKKLLLLNALLLCSSNAKKEKTKKEERSIQSKDQKSKKDKTGKNNEQLKAKVTQELIDGFQKIKEESAKDKSFDENIALIELVLNSSLIVQYKEIDWRNENEKCDMTREKFSEIIQEQAKTNAAMVTLSLQEQIDVLNAANKNYSFGVIEIIINNGKEIIALVNNSTWHGGFGKQKKTQKEIKDDILQRDAQSFLKENLFRLLAKIKVYQYSFNKKVLLNTANDEKTLDANLKGSFEAKVISFKEFADNPEKYSDDDLKAIISLKDSSEIKTANKMSLSDVIVKCTKDSLLALDFTKTPTTRGSQSAAMTDFIKRNYTVLLRNGITIAEVISGDAKTNFIRRFYTSLLNKYTLSEMITALKESKNEAYVYMASYIEKEIKNKMNHLEEEQEERAKFFKHYDGLFTAPPIFLEALESYAIQEILKHPKYEPLQGRESEVAAYLKDNPNFEVDIYQYTIFIINKIACYLSEHKSKK